MSSPDNPLHIYLSIYESQSYLDAIAPHPSAPQSNWYGKLYANDQIEQHLLALKDFADFQRRGGKYTTIHEAAKQRFVDAAYVAQTLTGKECLDSETRKICKLPEPSEAALAVRPIRDEPYIPGIDYSWLRAEYMRAEHGYNIAAYLVDDDITDTQSRIAHDTFLENFSTYAEQGRQGLETIRASIAHRERIRRHNANKLHEKIDGRAGDVHRLEIFGGGVYAKKSPDGSFRIEGARAQLNEASLLDVSYEALPALRQELLFIEEKTVLTNALRILAIAEGAPCDIPSGAAKADRVMAQADLTTGSARETMQRQATGMLNKADNILSERVRQMMNECVTQLHAFAEKRGYDSRLVDALQITVEVNTHYRDLLRHHAFLTIGLQKCEQWLRILGPAQKFLGEWAAAMTAHGQGEIKSRPSDSPADYLVTVMGSVPRLAETLHQVQAKPQTAMAGLGALFKRALPTDKAMLTKVTGLIDGREVAKEVGKIYIEGADPKVPEFDPGQIVPELQA